jgi:hypothetical protein
MEKSNRVLFFFLLAMSLVWGGIYWIFFAGK